MLRTQTNERAWWNLALSSVYQPWHDKLVYFCSWGSYLLCPVSELRWAIRTIIWSSGFVIPADARLMWIKILPWWLRVHLGSINFWHYIFSAGLKFQWRSTVFYFLTFFIFIYFMVWYFCIQMSENCHASLLETMKSHLPPNQTRRVQFLEHQSKIRARLCPKWCPWHKHNDFQYLWFLEWFSIVTMID